MNHYIICRYNVGLYSDNPYKVQDPDKWMAERLGKFERLLKSLANQTNQNFTLLIWMDKNTPEDFTHHIFKLTGRYVLDYRIVSDPKYYIVDSCKEKWVITSRIDNDDAYEPEFVEAIQNAFTQQEQLIDVKGVQCDERTITYYTSGRNKCNSPFISLIEPMSENIKTVIGGFHSDMFLSYSSTLLSDKVYYIQYIHDNNISNTIIGKPYDYQPTGKRQV